jgi:hypothetical protein
MKEHNSLSSLFEYDNNVRKIRQAEFWAQKKKESKTPQIDF